jgi:phospholipid/cholesterol/gamma-HCH transport system ATP-binding protein
MSKPEPIIEFINVHKAFNDNKVLNGIDLAIYSGETITIIGGSGIGKSVLLKLLLGLIRPDKGRILFEGKDIAAMDERELIGIRKKIGMLFQGSALFDSLTVYENVAYALREHLNLKEEEIKERVRKKLGLVGLEDVENKKPAELSGGMKKRVGLARAIAIEPEVILYDEPTTGLDPTNSRRINSLIKELQRVLKVTSIVVTHDIKSAYEVSDRIALIYEGRIKKAGAVKDFKNTEDEVIASFLNGTMESA